MKAKLQVVHPVLASSDVAASVRFYRGLGFTLLFQNVPEAPRYAGVVRDDVELHIQWADPEQWAYPKPQNQVHFPMLLPSRGGGIGQCLSSITSKLPSNARRTPLAPSAGGERGNAVVQFSAWARKVHLTPLLVANGHQEREDERTGQSSCR